jgi:hypothetical protein
VPVYTVKQFSMMMLNYQLSQLKIFILILGICLALYLIFSINEDTTSDSNESSLRQHHDSFIVNLPEGFFRAPEKEAPLASSSSSLTDFHNFVEKALSEVSVSVDGESVDVIEHFFWGKRDGLAIELGALDGTVAEGSMTYQLGQMLGWKRILIEADPTYRKNMKKFNPDAFSVNAAVCQETGKTLHYVSVKLVGGIIEFMDAEFLKSFHPKIYEAGKPHGNTASISNWNQFPRVIPVSCVSISDILNIAKTNHVNYFLLDVEVRK